jgi:muramidase (phage lysozyme)
MASPPVCDPGCQNVRAFLKLLRWAVNYPNDGDFVYYKLYGGKSFTDTSRHPNRAILASGRPDPSTAAGAYMLTYPAWKAAQLKGIVSDFTPASQDRLAWWRIGQRGAQLAVCGGRNTLEQAFKLLQPEWAPLPGGAQGRISVQTARNRYEGYLLAFGTGP